jgi:hypothetical protein
VVAIHVPEAIPVKVAISPNAVKKTPIVIRLGTETEAVIRWAFRHSSYSS